MMSWIDFAIRLFAALMLRALIGLDQIVTRLSLEAGVTAISWVVVAAVDMEDSSLSHGHIMNPAGAPPERDSL